MRQKPQCIFSILRNFLWFFLQYTFFAQYLPNFPKLLNLQGLWKSFHFSATIFTLRIRCQFNNKLGNWRPQWTNRPNPLFQISWKKFLYLKPTFMIIINIDNPFHCIFKTPRWSQIYSAWCHKYFRRKEKWSQLY